MRITKDEAFLNAVHNHEVFINSLMSGSLPCFPNQDRICDTSPCINIVDGTPYNGLSFLLLKKHQRENNFPTAEYVSSEQIENAKKDNPGVDIIKGEKGVPLSFSEKDPETSKFSYNSVTLYNVAQISNPEKINKFPEYLSQHRPKGMLYCVSSSPEDYLGEYFAAVSMNRNFMSIKEQSNEFKDQLKEKLLEKSVHFQKEGNTISVPNPLTLSKIINSSIKLSKHIIKDALSPDPETKYYESLEREQKQEQKQERKKVISR